MSKIQVTKDHAAKLIEVISHGLCRGAGRPEPGKMCVEAAVCYSLGLPHSDDPPCVSRAVRSFKIALNDSNWSSDSARAKGLARIAVAQLGSDVIDDAVFVKELARLTIKRIVPIALRAAARIHPRKEHRDKLEAAAVNCEQQENAAAAYHAAAARYAADAARYAADAAAAAARYAAAAARYAAAAAAAAAARYAAAADAAAADAAARDDVLTLMAEIGVEALTLVKSPGCEWLDLIPKEVA